MLRKGQRGAGQEHPEGRGGRRDEEGRRDDALILALCVVIEQICQE